MKSPHLFIPFAAVLALGHSLLHAQETSALEPANFFGKSAAQIEAEGSFGRRFFDRPRRGMFNIPDMFQYSERILSDNPYVTEIGFLGDEAVYFLFRKASLEPAREIREAEVLSLLYRCAGNSTWSEESTDDEGTLYEFKVSSSQKVRLFAYLTPNRGSLLVWSPVVAPNLNRLDTQGRLSISFADGAELTLAEGEDAGEAVTIFYDIPAPANLDDFSGGRNARAAAAEKLREVLADRQPSEVILFSNDGEMRDFLESRRTPSQGRESERSAPE